MVTPIKDDAKLVTINIDGKDYQVPAGGNLVDMAKWVAGNDIPVFCYHPKMEPVGMCRMCLVEMGSIARDRATNEIVKNEDGTAQIRWLPKLQTACTTTATDGMYIKTSTQAVVEGREAVLEFLLTSHPLDCPICDKGGECPLQNLTMEHGPGVSRMYYDDKQKLAKHYPLGDLIYLDQERCIQCARCIRFQDEIAGDAVLAFHERGRRLQIITNSDPGFDSYFSGNTTDICPVGALTTGDFRFGARPWELTEVPSISPWDAAGENINLSTRLDRDFGGRAMIKRVMPRQNEYVNEIWISDKTRFGHHFTRSENRLTTPMIRKGTIPGETSWNEAFTAVANALKNAGGSVAAIAGGTASNEDLYELAQLVKGLGGSKLGAFPTSHTGADLVAQVGLPEGSNLRNLGKGDAILVIASDLEEEVPLWHLRLKGAQDRGAFLVVANARSTRLEEIATEDPKIRGRVVNGGFIRYTAGTAVEALTGIKQNYAQIADQLANAKNLVIVAGAEGLTLEGHRALMQAAANLLVETGHAGKVNSGLLSPLPGANGMGLYYMGFTPETTAEIAANPPKALLVLNADMLDDDPTASAWLSKVETVISLTLFMDKTAQAGQFVLPVQSFAERDGTFTNGERRVQRFYTAQGPMGDAMPAWKALGSIAQAAGLGRAKLSAAAVMTEIAKNMPAFAGITYTALARTERQFPDVGGEDKYYGGTAYQNTGGLGKQIPLAGAAQVQKVAAPSALKVAKGEILIVPTTRLYDRSLMFAPTVLVRPRVALPFVLLNPADAKTLKVTNGDTVEVSFDGGSVQVRAVVTDSVSAGAAFLPRKLTENATPLVPTVGKISKVTESVAVEG
jgi:NADH-quinone oxidoreductase subunit G